MKKIIGMNLLLALFIASAAGADNKCDLSDQSYPALNSYDFTGLPIFFRHACDISFPSYNALTSYNLTGFSGTACIVGSFAYDNVSGYVQFENGKLDGESVLYYNNGNIKSKITYSKNKLDGPDMAYGEDGTAVHWCNWKLGKLDGPYILYWVNGNRSNLDNYKDGNQEGEQVSYDIDGNINSIVYYKNEYFSDGQIAGSAVYRDITLTNMIGFKVCTDGRRGNEQLDCRNAPSGNTEDISKTTHISGGKLYKDGKSYDYWIHQEYNADGHLIHDKQYTGYNEWYTYINGQVRYSITQTMQLDRILKFYTYDFHGNMIHEYGTDGEEEWYEYDSYGKKINSKNSYGYEHWYEYDANGNLIHDKNNDGYDEWYNEHGDLIHVKESDGKDKWHEYKYDANGHMIHEKDSDGSEQWYGYDSNGHLIHRKDSDGYEEWYEYDAHGNKIHAKTSDGGDAWYTYVYNNRNGKYLIEWMLSNNIETF